VTERRFPLLRRTALILLAYVAGCLAAGFLLAISLGAFAEGVGIEASLAIGSYLCIFALFPLGIVIVSAELLRLRSILAWVGIGCAMGIFSLLVLGRLTPGISNERPYLFLAAGIVWGLVYWLIAGRQAGWRRTKPD